MRKVILDCDTGSDDAIAIILALANKELDVLGITVTWGNNSVYDCVKNTLKVIEFCGKNVPVYKGCEGPLVKRLTYERNLLPNVISYVNDKGEIISLHPSSYDLPNNLTVQNKHAVSYLIETLMNSDEKITLVPVGPATNIGAAFALEPRIKDHIEEIIFMGGAIDMGNVTPYAEANFYNDPEAIKIILNSGVKTTIIGLNATHSVAFDLTDSQKFAQLNDIGEFVSYLINTRIDVATKLGWGAESGGTIHDALAVAYLLDKSVIADIRNQKVDIYISGEKDGGLYLTDKGNENVFIAYKGDHDKYFEMIKKAIISLR